jgi:hypothetical protein
VLFYCVLCVFVSIALFKCPVVRPRRAQLRCAIGDDRCAVCCSAFAVHCAVRYSCHQSLRLMVVPFVAVLTRNCD